LEKTLQETQSVLSDPFKAWRSPVVWKTGSDDADRIKQWLGVDVSEDFFDLDGLECVWSGIIFVQSRNSPRSDRIRITGR
jgi:hypothetical protein